MVLWLLGIATGDGPKGPAWAYIGLLEQLSIEIRPPLTSFAFYGTAGQEQVAGWHLPVCGLLMFGLVVVQLVFLLAWYPPHYVLCVQQTVFRWQSYGRGPDAWVKLCTTRADSTGNWTLV